MSKPTTYIVRIYIKMLCLLQSHTSFGWCSVRQHTRNPRICATCNFVVAFIYVKQKLILSSIQAIDWEYYIITFTYLKETITSVLCETRGLFIITLALSVNVFSVLHA